MNLDSIQAPLWFNEAIKQMPEVNSVTVRGCEIRYRVWGRSGLPTLVLVHGMRAHARWWDFIAPLLMDHFQVLAVDLSGMGDSGRRSQYTISDYAADINQVMAAHGCDQTATVIAHSFGGFAATHALLAEEALTQRLILVDSAVRPPEDQWVRPPDNMLRQKKYYPTKADALARFKLMPPQSCENDFIVNYIAEHSVMETNQGWCWKFDNDLFPTGGFGDRAADFKQIVSSMERLAIVYGDQSEPCSARVITYMKSLADEHIPFIEIPQAHHHIMLDQPIAFIATIRTILAQWQSADLQRIHLSETKLAKI